MRRRVEQWAGAKGLSYLPKEGRRSWTTSCIKMPAGKGSKDVVSAVKKAGWTIGSGYGALKDTTFRIGHMGDHTVEGVEALLPVLDGALA
jgi:aspartate aminotransferase-like enzyme